MPIEIVDAGRSLTGLGAIPDLQSLLLSTQRYGSVLQQLLASTGMKLPVIPVAMSPEALIRLAKQTVASDVGQILKRHEQAAHKQFAEEAKKLAQRGIDKKEIERRVRAAVEKLPATQARRAVEELRKTGSVSKQTQSALKLAKKLYPGVQEQVQKATAPVRKLQKSVRDIQKTVKGVAQIAKSVQKKLPTPLQKTARDVQKLLKGAKVPQVPKAAKDVKKAAKAVQRAVPVARDVTKALKGAKGLQRAVKDIEKKSPVSLKEAASVIKNGKLDAKALQKLGEKKGKQLLKEYGAKHGAEALKKLAPELKLPSGIDPSAAADLIFSGKKVTAERAGQAAYATGKGVAEQYITAQTGFPIKLPAKISVKEFKKSITSLFPTDLDSAIDTGIAIGVQYASSAVASLVAGSAIGSVIPGIGTVVGIAVALAINALKDDFKKLFAEEPQPYEKKCPTKVKCPEPPRDKNPMELLPWVAHKLSEVGLTVAQDQKQKYCGRGSGPDCEARLYWLERRVMDIIYPPSEYKSADEMFKDSTVSVIGLPYVKHLIKLYEKAPKSYPYFDAGGMEYVAVRKPPAPKKALTFQEKEQIRLGLHRIGSGSTAAGGGMVPVAQRTFRKGTQRIEQRPNNIPIVLALLKKRKQMLDGMMDKYKRINSLVGELSTLRWDLATESKNAFTQYALDPNKYTQEWLETVGKMWQALIKRENQLQGEMKERMRIYQERVAKDPSLATKKYQVD